MKYLWRWQATKYSSEDQVTYMHNFIPNLKIGKIDDYLLSLANHMHCSINQVIEDKMESPLQHLSHTWIIWTDQEFFLTMTISVILNYWSQRLSITVGIHIIQIIHTQPEFNTYEYWGNN